MMNEPKCTSMNSQHVTDRKYQGKNLVDRMERGKTSIIRMVFVLKNTRFGQAITKKQ